MDKIIILGHENPDVDSIVSGYLLEKILKKKGYSAEFIVPDKSLDKDTLEICRKYDLEPTKYQKDINLKDSNINYILVDHNERNVKGNIIGIIDHHPTSKKINVENYYNQNVVSTAYFIAKNSEELLDLYDIKLAVLASFIDTVSFNSNKGTKEDKEWIIKICDKYGFNYSEFEKEGLRLTELLGIEKDSLNGLKKHVFNGIKVESSYIQIDSIKKYQDYINEIIKYLKKYRNKQSIDAFVFIVHNMTELKTMYNLITKDSIEKRYYDSYVSRGSAIIPEVEQDLKRKEDNYDA